MAGSTEHVVTGLSINGNAYCYVRVQPLIKYSILNFSPQINCGTLDQLISRVEPGVQLHGWRILMMPHPGELDLLLPLIGTSETNDVFSPIDTLTEFDVAVRLKSSTLNVWTTEDCKVDKALFRAQMGVHPLQLQLDVIGKTSVPDGGTWAPGSITVDSPYEWTSTNGAVSIGGTVRACRSMAFLYDNHLRTRFNNSVTADAIQNIMRTVHFGFDTPYTDDEDDLLTSATGASRTAGIAGSVTFTHGNQSFAISVPKMVWEAKPPSLLGKEQDLRLDQYYLGVKDSGAVCTFTNDPTA